MEWLKKFQPLVYRECDTRRDKLLDFKFLRGFSHGCKQVFSGDRWAITGDAGVFLDPFYSPGNDFIGMSNSYICALIEHDRKGDPVGPYAQIYQQIYFSFYESTLALYRDQYPLFGDAEVMSTKVIWDYAYYWGVLCQIVFQDRLTDLRLFSDLKPELEAVRQLNIEVQAFFTRWMAVNPPINPAAMLDQGALPWFYELNRTLHDPLDDDGVRARIRNNVDMLRNLAAGIVAQAQSDCPGLEGVSVAGDAQAAPQLFELAA
jgi:hypothetical protein